MLEPSSPTIHFVFAQGSRKKKKDLNWNIINYGGNSDKDGPDRC